MFIKRTEDAPDNEESMVKFEAYIEKGKEDKRYEDYINKKYQRKELFTDFNIDSKCNLKHIFKEDTDNKKNFEEIWKDTCYGENKCILKPEDLTLFYQIKDECKHRIDFLNITSYDFIIVVGCTQDKVTIPLFDT